MAFMKPVITEKQDWAAVETNNGTWWVPFEVLSSRETESAKSGDFEPLLQYTEGTRVYNDQSSIKKGYGVRLSAPGYMDATDWEVYGNLKEAQRRARELAEESEGDHATKKSSRHATKKSPAQLEREITETLSKSKPSRSKPLSKPSRSKPLSKPSRSKPSRTHAVVKRVPKTQLVHVVQGNYGYGQGWEDVTAEDTREKAKQRLREYRDNERGVPFRLIRRRERLAAAA